MYLKLKDGKSKAVTLSYDDGVLSDVKLTEIMARYGLKGTFNICSGRYPNEEEKSENINRILKLSEVKALYMNSGNEVAVHGYRHLSLERLSESEVVTEIIRDKESIEENLGIITRGMAYPYGRYSQKVISVLKNCGIAYARTVKSTESFGFPENWYEWNPTCHHNNPRLMELAKRFIESDTWEPAQMFYLWGHSYEFNNDNNWDVIEKFAEYIGGRENVWYATNIEIYDYIRAYESLNISVDKRIIHNPSATDVWMSDGEESFCVKAGTVLKR